MNQVVIVGNVARDPELKRTQSGIATCTLSVAVNRPKNKEGVSVADFLSVVTWREQAENCAKYLTKGKKVAVSGSIQTRNYEKDGHKVYVTEIMANRVEFLSPSGSTAPGENQSSTSTSSDGFTEVDDDELPF